MGSRFLTAILLPLQQRYAPLNLVESRDLERFLYENGEQGELSLNIGKRFFTDIESVCYLCNGESLLPELTCAGWFCFGGSLLSAPDKLHESWPPQFPPVVVPLRYSSSIAASPNITLATRR